jgi:hypothetical protein
LTAGAVRSVKSLAVGDFTLHFNLLLLLSQR